jgi:hypothetical protein
MSLPFPRKACARSRACSRRADEGARTSARPSDHAAGHGRAGVASEAQITLDGHLLGGAAEPEGDPVAATEALQDREVEIHEVPAGQDVGIELVEQDEEAVQQRALVGETFRAAKRSRSLSTTASS